MLCGIEGVRYEDTQLPLLLKQDNIHTINTDLPRSHFSVQWNFSVRYNQEGAGVQYSYCTDENIKKTLQIALKNFKALLTLPKAALTL